MQEKDMYQIQANHFLSNHFGSLAANPRNLEKLITHRDWLQKQLRLTQAMINKMSKTMMEVPDDDNVTYDGDMFIEARNIIQREQQKFWSSWNIPCNDMEHHQQMEKLWLSEKQFVPFQVFI